MILLFLFLTSFSYFIQEKVNLEEISHFHLAILEIKDFSKEIFK